MPSFKRDRRFVAEAASDLTNSRKLSLTHSEKSSPSSHRRRSSNPQIFPPSSSATLPAVKRSPLAPLDPQTDQQSIRDIVMMTRSDEQLVPRKPSITLINATRPTPYPQRTSSRRPLPPSQARRISLPSLSLDSTSSPATPTYLDHSPIYDDNLYEGLSTFTFGDAKSNPTASTRRPDEMLEGIPPSQRLGSMDLTPRPSVSYQVQENGWSSPSEDEDEEKRRSTRGKMRAIDDGTRRPSLPFNVPNQIAELTPSDLSTSPVTDSNDPSSTASGNGTSKGKGKPRPILSNMPSSSSHTDELSFDLDTDVDLMAVDAEPLISDQASVRTFGGGGQPETRSLYGGLSDSEDLEQLENDEEDQRQSRNWETATERRGSLPVDIPQPKSRLSESSSSLVQQVYPARLTQAGGDIQTIAQLRRPSRSVDDDLSALSLYTQKAQRASVHSLGTGIGGVPGSGAASEPNIRGLALAVAQEQVVAAQAAAIAAAREEANAMGEVQGDQLDGSWDIQQAQNESPYQGLDLDYILSGSGPSPMSSTRPGGVPFPFDGRKGSTGADGMLGLPGGREREGSWGMAGIFGGLAAGRRTSTGTVGTVGDDTFLKFVKKGDTRYSERHREWSFARERAEGERSGLGESERGGMEVWRCVWVGRYKVERALSRNTDPSKPPQVRLNVRHIADPYSKGNTRGGPVTFVHKHSRAQAFSIFRGHALPTRHLKTNTSILLAPKKVQEQYTSTRTTSKLSTHGLLEERHQNSATPADRERSRARATPDGRDGSSSTGSRTQERERAPEREATDPGKGKGRERPREEGSDAPSTADPSASPSTSTTSMNTMSRGASSGSGSQASTIGSVVPGSNASATSFASSQEATTSSVASHSRASSRPSIDLPPRRPDTAMTSTSNSSTITLSTLDYSILSHARAHPHSHSHSISSMHHGHRNYPQRQVGRLTPATRTTGSITSLEEQPVPRTSHAEAFATLDPTSIEYLRTHNAPFDAAYHSSEQESPPSRFKGLRKLFAGQPVKGAKHGGVPGGPSSAVLEGRYTPPWLTMAARSKQEEQERAIKDFHDSFTSVGLLPPSKAKKNPKKPSKRRVSENVLDQVPHDALYMLLPMWPGETDAASTNSFEDPMKYEIQLEDRQYLLVYYVPFVSKNSRDDEKEEKKEKKRARQSQTGSSSSHHSHHSDSGTPKEHKNNVALKSFNILARLVSHRDVNGSGIRVPSSGLSVTGAMSEAMAGIPRIRFQVDDLSPIIGFCDKRERGVEFLPEATEKLGLCVPRGLVDPDVDVPLTPIGRAAVEMAWLGALAVMGFGNP
ncbi:hypothetical protein BD410DRAFT_570879 [Rickenella mellea]|uniref:Uncharacterized protein n=1 Tax=Rickenella mellea TaxID=50990 RepID=A0A4Y7QGE8_9AGAM|nr:hypothetical protein BD410DRAFT_570879 [Rickenella mellea]